MKTYQRNILTAALFGLFNQSAMAGGGGCGDSCDKIVEIMNCTANEKSRTD